MKKIAIILLSILVAGMFVACNQDVTVDAQVHANIELGTFVLDGKNYATLQEAVNAKLGKGLSKAIGDNDGVIYLTKNASGPGAVIDKLVEGGVIIDFAGYTYSFTNVTGLQGGDNPKAETFGLGITSGADVTLKGLQQIDLNDTATTDLTMVYVAGANTKLTIEDAPKMKVEPDQYVFWAADGATLTIGKEDATASASVSGKVAATGGTTETSKPTINLQGGTTVQKVEATAAKVTLSNTASVETVSAKSDSEFTTTGDSKITKAVEATDSKITIAGNTAVSGTISADKSEVSVTETSTINAAVQASNESTVTITSENNVITNLDKTTDSTVVVTEKLQVDEVTGGEGKDNVVITTGDGEITDSTGAESKDVDTDQGSTKYVALVDGVLYEDMATAVADAAMSKKTLFVCADDTTITVPEGNTVVLDLGGFDVASISSAGTLTIQSSGTVKSITTVFEATIIEGGTYSVDPATIGTIPVYCVVTVEDPYWTVSRKTSGVASITRDESGELFFDTLQAALNSVKEGETITVLKDISVSNELDINENKSFVLSLNGHTITGTENSKDSKIFNVTSGTLKIDGTTANSAINAEAIAVFVADGANLIVNGGTYSNSYKGSDGGSNVFDVQGTAEISNVTLSAVVKGIRAEGANASVTVSESIAKVAPYYGLFNAAEGGSLTIESGTYSTSYSDEKYHQMIDIKKNGSVTIKGGNFTTSYSGTAVVPALVVFNGGNTSTGVGDRLVINGGEFTYAGKLGYINGSMHEVISITDGTFNVSSVVVDNGKTGNVLEYGITGGLYSSDPSDYVVAGYTAEQIATSTWKVKQVKEDEAVASITRGQEVFYFKTLTEAVKNSSDNDTVVLIDDITESVSIKKSNLTIDLNEHTLTASNTDYAIKLSECDNVTIKNGSVVSSGHVFVIGDHQYTIIKWKYADQYPLYGYHPLAPAKNIVLQNVNAQATGDKSMFYYTNIEDDITRGAPSNYVDNDLYGQYIYKTGYTTQDQSDYHKVDEVFTVCTDKDSVTIIGGTYTASSSLFGKMKRSDKRTDGLNNTWYTDVLFAQSGSFSSDEIGRFLAEGKCLIGNSENNFIVGDSIPSSYFGNVNRNYYTYVGGADSAIKYAEFGETVLIRENSSIQKLFGQDDNLTVVYEIDGVSYTGALPVQDFSDYTVIIEDDESDSRIKYFSIKFIPVVAIYDKTGTEVKQYASLKNAIQSGDLKNDYTLVILDDFTVGDDMTYSYGGGKYKCAMGFATRSTIDFKGHMITYTGSGACIFSSQQTGYLYFKDSSGTNAGGITATGTGCCVRLENAKSDYTYFSSGRYVAEKNSALILNGGTGITLSGGYYESKTTNAVSGGGKKVTALSVTGGRYVSASGEKDISNNCTISGGTFTYDWNSDPGKIASGKECVDNGNGTYTVQNKTN